MTDFNLSATQIEMMHSLFSRYKDLEKVSVFGSRAMGTDKPNSDIDLVFWGDISDLDKRRLYNQLEELPIPYQFDFIAYDDIEHRALKDHINRCSRPIYTKPKDSTHHDA